MLPFHIPKRRRDEEDSDEERYSKKSRRWSFQRHESQNPLQDPGFPFFHRSTSCLPPSPPRQRSPPPVTPSFSKHAAHSSPMFNSHDVVIPSDPSYDVDMEDDDFDIIGSPPPDSPIMQVLRPAKLNAQLFAQPSSNTGRIPTPIHGTFYAPRGPMLRSTSYPTDASPLPPPVLRKQANVDMARDWRMPSPISEDEDIPDTPTAFTQSQLSRLSMASNNNSTETMETDDTDPQSHTRLRRHPESGDRNENIEPPPTPLGKKGRARSGAFTGKGRFSMGYRDDCDKCRARIPGHYSHFLPG